MNKPTAQNMEGSLILDALVIWIFERLDPELQVSKHGHREIYSPVGIGDISTRGDYKIVSNMTKKGKNHCSFKSIGQGTATQWGRERGSGGKGGRAVAENTMGDGLVYATPSTAPSTSIGICVKVKKKKKNCNLH